MASNHDAEKQEDTLRVSRRRAFIWAGEVAAGLSLAGIGLGIMGAKPLNALAASQSGQAATVPHIPDCIPCPSYGTFCCRSCFTDSNCQPGGNTILYYYYSGGCVLPGQQCPTYVGCSNCVSSCNGATCS